MKSEARDLFLEPNRQQAWVEWGRAGVFWQVALNIAANTM